MYLPQGPGTGQIGQGGPSTWDVEDEQIAEMEEESDQRSKVKDKQAANQRLAESGNMIELKHTLVFNYFNFNEV